VGVEEMESFIDIKKCLISAPTLVHPDYTKPFVLHTDASNYGIGAVLSQKDEAGNEHPIVYLSRTLTDAETH
jgi:phospholipid-translocating ATPase